MHDDQQYSKTEATRQNQPRRRRRFLLSALVAITICVAGAVLFRLGPGQSWGSRGEAGFTARGRELASKTKIDVQTKASPVAVAQPKVQTKVAVAPVRPSSAGNDEETGGNDTGQAPPNEPAPAASASMPSTPKPRVAPRQVARSEDKPQRTRPITRKVIVRQPARKSVRLARSGVNRSLASNRSQSGGVRRAAVDWPQYRGPNRDGISPEKGSVGDWPDDGPRVLWKTSIGTGFSSIAVSNGRAYTMGNSDDQDTVYCLDAETGRVLWKHTYPSALAPQSYEGGPNATPTVDGNAVYTFSKHGQLFCLDANSGKVLWSKNAQQDFGASPPGWGYSCSPLVLGKLVIVEFGARGAALVAFNKANGQVAWKSGNDGVGYSSPVAFTWNDLTCIASFNASGLVVYNA
ncbi:MAG: PQQ-like beta-propeller repeat protein, partial [Armatimonadota bacterium]|nr:PQQ-like beta-propeller repeat protein [Armatimonadota bacterium]